jgi:hypothetical protein
MTEAEQIMKRCQAGTRNYEEANNLHAACYGIIGKLLAQPEQEPVQEPFCFFYVENGEEYFAPKGAYVPDNAQPLYTAPPQRTWVGLTDEEIKTICSENGWDSSWQSLRFARAIEAKLKQKNG